MWKILFAARRCWIKLVHENVNEMEIYVNYKKCMYIILGKSDKIIK